ncbi:hypothetical protein [Nannocystis bainbridge]|uniref:Uncharacterized protein n=1 Tax=Nannocystis bainbridge TaxID=2995303 RepID=A0ABT5E5Y3_9BACT|nr:hypothetical protein [Nannocystis bainbridge]MDC0720348.1 hypothetical protein [Nannocystis bainbridge]
MPTTTHEPSGLIAIRALVDLERERQDREQAAAAAREAAEAAAREVAEARARAEAEALALAAAEARRRDERRLHEERLRAAEVEGRLRAGQAAHLAQVQAELDARTGPARPASAVGLWTAGALGLVGLGLAVLLKTATAAPAPALAPVAAAEDTSLRDARQAIAELRAGIADIERSNEADRQALANATARAAASVVAPAAAPAPTRPRPSARPTARPGDKPPVAKPGGLKICDTNDPLAEDC